MTVATLLAHSLRVTWDPPRSSVNGLVCQQLENLSNANRFTPEMAIGRAK